MRVKTSTKIRSWGFGSSKTGKNGGLSKKPAGKCLPKKRIKQIPPTSRFKGLTSNQIRKLQKENSDARIF